MNIRESVFEALDNAVENGYPMREWKIEAILDDLLMCDADLEDLERAVVEPFVVKWLSLPAKS